MPRQKRIPIQSVRGMRDILPEEQSRWEFILNRSHTILSDYGFGKIDTPIVEESELFVRSVGISTDIVEKEMYRLKTRGGDDLVLRPEFTAGIARAYIEHGMKTLPQPVKLFSYGPIFRHDQPQAGRYRQFWQVNAEIIGEDGAAADAELIFILYQLLREFGFKEVMVKLNSLGDSLCRPNYISALKDYYRNKFKKLCQQCLERYKKNPLRLLDCKEEQCQEFKKDAPQILDYLDEICKKHFQTVLEFLEETNVPYMLDPFTVRGLDYYTRTVFEMLPPEDLEYRGALGSGGRYDRLIELLGGKRTSAVGWALGIDRILFALKDVTLPALSRRGRANVFLAQLGDLGKKRSLVLFEQLRKSGVRVQANFGKDSIKSQLRIASKIGARFTLLLGQKEALENTVILRDMESSVQETIAMEEIVAEVKKHLRER